MIIKRNRKLFEVISEGQILFTSTSIDEAQLYVNTNKVEEEVQYKTYATTKSLAEADYKLLGCLEDQSIDNILDAQTLKLLKEYE